MTGIQVAQVKGPGVELDALVVLVLVFFFVVMAVVAAACANVTILVLRASSFACSDVEVGAPTQHPRTSPDVTAKTPGQS